VKNIEKNKTLKCISVSGREVNVVNLGGRVAQIVVCMSF
jgi:hypothetical protein